ncbi:MAG TPA: DUF2272 domain-containing protein [Alphaproteobacteria bacterium]|jgi:hypothetical protein
MAFAPRPALFAVAALIALAGCASRDAHVPEFARKPYEPFTREAAVAIALREWRLFGEVVVHDGAPAEAAAANATDHAERRQGLWQRVGEYWWLGLNDGQAGHGFTGLHDAQGRRFPPEQDGTYAWSAAFISYVMRIAGAGARFPYSASHFVYVDAAVRASRSGEGILRAEDPALYAPQLGDLICVARGPQKALEFADLPFSPFAGHCDVVVMRDAGQLAGVGGNVDDAVAMKYVPLTPEGRLISTPDHPWLAVIHVLYDPSPDGASASSQPKP